jgi:hypothetical protein
VKRLKKIYKRVQDCLGDQNKEEENEILTHWRRADSAPANQIRKLLIFSGAFLSVIAVVFDLQLIKLPLICSSFLKEKKRYKFRARFRGALASLHMG